MVKHYVEYLMPQMFFFFSSKVEEIEERDPKKVKMPENSFAFRFFDANVTEDSEKCAFIEKQNVSGYYYMGKQATLDEIKELCDCGDEFIAKLSAGGYNRFVITEFSKIIALKEDDTVI